MGSGPAAGADSGRVMELAEQLRHGILREIDAEADQYGAFAERDGRPAGDAGSGTCKSLHGRSGNDETRGSGVLSPARPEIRRGGGDPGVGDGSSGSFESRGAGDDIAETLGRGQDHPGERRRSRCDAGAEKEQTFRDFLDGLPDAGVQETAEMILTFALSFEGEPRDDMTVLVGGIYG